MNMSLLYNSLRGSTLFKGTLEQSQVDTINAITTLWGGFSNDASMAQLAYVLGTIYRECGHNMAPVREGFAMSDAVAIADVTAMYNRGIIQHNYALPDPATHKSYFGRGYVQITWADNYKRIGHLIGADLYNNPDLALDPAIAGKIAVFGMQGGWFTGHKLQEYINSSATDLFNARRVINGTDHASEVAGYANAFLTSIKQAAIAT